MRADNRVQLQVRVRPEIKRRLIDAAARRDLSASRITEIALRQHLDRLDAEDAPSIAHRARRQLLEELEEA